MTDPTPAETLKACPFCGGAAIIWGTSSTSIQCTNDQCIIGESAPFNDFSHRADAIAAWNNRPDAGEVRTYRDDAFIWRWVERGLYDKDISAKEALSLLAHSPMAPWNNGRWDVDHKPYAAKLYADHPKAAAIRKLP